MSSLLTSDQIYYLTGQFAGHFDTFAPFHTIVINKEPIQTITPIIDNNYIPGYGNDGQNTNVTYTPVSGVYNGLVLTDKPPKPGEVFQEIKTSIGQGKAKIKVQENCRNFILNGRTENVIADGITYNVVTEDGIQNYLGLVYYYFLLERTT